MARMARGDLPPLPVGDLEPVELEAFDDHASPPSPPRRRWWPFLVGGGLVVLLAVWWSQPDKPPDKTAEPTPPAVRLVGRDATGLVSVDLDTGAITHRRLDLRSTDEVVGLTDFVAYLAGGHAWALPYDLAGKPLDLGEAGHLMAGLDRKTVWLIRRTTAVRVDHRGRRVALVRRPGIDGLKRPVAEVKGGLVLEGPGLLIWDPVENRVRYSVEATFVAAGETTVAYSSCEPGAEHCQLHLVDDEENGGDRVVGTRSVDATPQAGAISPDGLTLAAVWTRPDTEVLVLLDIPSGRIRSVIPEPKPATELAWSPDGKRLVVSGSGVVTVHRADGRGMVQYPWTGLSGNAVGVG